MQVGQSTTTALDWVTLGIAVLGFGLSVAAFVIRWLDFRRSSSQLVVELEPAYMGHGGVLSWRMGHDAVPTAPASMPKRAYLVRVRNKGLAATTIERVDLDIGMGARVLHDSESPGASAPARLEGMSAEVFLFDANYVESMAQAVARGVGLGSIAAAVHVGDGSSRRTKAYPLHVWGE